MPKKTVIYECSACGAHFPVKTGRCSNCGNFGTMMALENEENPLENDIKRLKGENLARKAKKSPLNDAFLSENRLKTANEEINRVLGGGFMPGSLVLLAGEPGVGKSTLALQIFQDIAGSFYFSAEESVLQVQKRAERLQKSEKKPRTEKKEAIFTPKGLADVIMTIAEEKPALAIVDSAQVLKNDAGFGGSVAIQREIAENLLHLTKKTSTCVILIGHVTKNGDIAGPKALEHLVDVVLELRGDRTTELRLLKSPKNRFGATSEVGVLEFSEKGLAPVKNPASYFINDHHRGLITVQKDGNRYFLLEIQALTVPSVFGQPRRTSTGLDLSRFHVLLAVLDRFSRFGCQKHDAYLSVIGGLRLQERVSDLAVLLSVVQSRHKAPFDEKNQKSTLALGEIGLRGEIRPVSHLENRIKEALATGITKIIIPKPKTPLKGIIIPKEVEIFEVSSLSEAIQAFFTSKTNDL